MIDKEIENRIEVMLEESKTELELMGAYEDLICDYDGDITNIIKIDTKMIDKEIENRIEVMLEESKTELELMGAYEDLICDYDGDITNIINGWYR